MNDLKLSEAPVKPYGILETIAKRFGFEMGVPQHEFAGRTSQITRVDFLFRERQYPASCTLSTDGYPFPDTQAYVCMYDGPIVENGIIREGENYVAYVLKNVVGCRGQMQEAMVVSNAEGVITAPDWFPLGK